MTERFEHKPSMFVGIGPQGKFICVGLKSREDFDHIDLPCIDHGENEKGHVLSKSLDDGNVMVVFQYWIKSLTIDARLEDLEKRKKAAA